MRLLVIAVAMFGLAACSGDETSLPSPSVRPDNGWFQLSAAIVCDQFDDLIDDEWLGEEVESEDGLERDDTAWPVCGSGGDESSVRMYFYGAGESEIVTPSDFADHFDDCDTDEATEKLGDWRVIGMHCDDDKGQQETYLQAVGPETGVSLEITAAVGVGEHSLQNGLDLMHDLLNLEPDPDFAYRDPDWSGLTADEMCDLLVPVVDDDFLGVPIEHRLAEPEDDTAVAHCLLSDVDLTDGEPSGKENVIDLTTYDAGAELEKTGDEVASLFVSDTCERPQVVDETVGQWHVYGMHCDEVDGFARSWLYAVGPSTAVELQIHGDPALLAVRLRHARGLLDAILRSAEDYVPSSSS